MSHVSPSVWESSSRSTGSSSPASAAAALERWILEPGEHGLAIAVAPHARLVAVVVACEPDAIIVAPLPRDVLPGDLNPWSRQIVRAPSGPLRCLKFNESEGQATSSSSSNAVLLVAATPREAYLWQIHGTDISESVLHLVGVEAPPPCLPALAFDSSGSLVVIGGIDAKSAPRLSIFVTSTGGVLAQAQVPTVQSDDACATIVTACNFLREDFAFVLIAATHVVNRKVGRILAYNMRGCGGIDDSDVFSASHETMPLQGAPFLALGLHHAQASTFLVGGEGVVYIFQVRVVNDGLLCEQLSEVFLGPQNVPVWLRNEAVEDDARRSCCDDTLHASEDDGGVLAINAIGCRVSGGPTSLGLYGTAALAITANAVYAIWGHRQCAERLGTTLALGAAAVCVAPLSGVLIAGYSHAFAEGGEIMRLTLNPELIMPLASRSPVAEGKQCRSSAQNLQLDEEAPSDPPICSVMPIAPIPQDSMLGQALAPSRPSTPGVANLKRAGSAPLRGQAASNQPVTFHRKVKSAGYGPSGDRPRVLGRPQLCATRRPPKPDFGPQPRAKSRSNHSQPESDQIRIGKLLAGGYCAANSGPPLEHCRDQAIPSNSCAILDLCYTPQATHLIVAGSDRTIASYRLPLAKTRAPDGRPRALGFSGHTSDIVSMCPSYADSQSTGGGGGPLLLTTASDRTVRLWALGGSHAGEDLICFDRLRTNSRSAHKDENPMLESTQDAQFMCLDAAIALATGARLGIYKYQLHDQDMNDDIKRLQRLGSYKCCGLLALPREPSAGQSIVTLAANNAVMSGTLLVASSSKRIYAWDVGAEKVLACVPEASLHSRPITCLRLAQPHSEFQSLETMDLFYSAATDNTVKLWDLRSMQECRRFMGGHTHTSQKLRCRVSPCLRYLCVPSEDGGVCAYDIRTGNVLGSRHCHRDAVSAVDIHPRSGCMASGGFDGVVNLYRVPSSEVPSKPRGSGGIVERRAASETRRLPRTREVCMDLPS